MSNFKKIRPVGAEVFHADGQTERHDEVVVAFRNFSKAPKMITYAHTYVIHTYVRMYILASFPCKLNTFRKRVKNAVTSNGIQVGVKCK